MACSMSAMIAGPARLPGRMIKALTFPLRRAALSRGRCAILASLVMRIQPRLPTSGSQSTSSESIAKCFLKISAGQPLASVVARGISSPDNAWSKKNTTL